MKQTLFLFGRTPDLSYLELASIFPAARRISPEAAVLDDRMDFVTILAVLGGTVKVAEVVGTTVALTESTLLPYALRECKDRHITFGISGYGGIRVPIGVTPSLKKALTDRGITARFVLTKHDDSLSSVVVAKQHVTEFIVLQTGNDIMLGVTRAVQNFEDWNKRDFGRPAPDPKHGMLPPKVARMIVNIALPFVIPGEGMTKTKTLLDPFCGVGTIVAEALLRGANVIGADISPDAVDNTKKNLAWLRHEYPIISRLYSTVFVADATHIRDKLTSESVDAIVTEPYMGELIDDKKRTRLTPDRVKNTLKGLEKLYIGSLREWATLVKPGGRVVMALPAYVTPRGIMRVKNVIDRCEILGYTLLTGPIEYSRPQAIVRREFFVFEKK